MRASLGDRSIHRRRALSIIRSQDSFFVKYSLARSRGCLRICNFWFMSNCSNRMIIVSPQNRNETPYLRIFSMNLLHLDSGRSSNNTYKMICKAPKGPSNPNRLYFPRRCNTTKDKSATLNRRNNNNNSNRNNKRKVLFNLILRLK